MRDEPEVARSTVQALAWTIGAMARQLPDNGARIMAELSAAPLTVAALAAGVSP